MQKIVTSLQFFRNLESTITNVTLAEWLTEASNGIAYYTTNGLITPTLPITTGQQKRFRLVAEKNNFFIAVLLSQLRKSSNKHIVTLRYFVTPSDIHIT